MDKGCQDIMKTFNDVTEKVPTVNDVCFLKVAFFRKCDLKKNIFLNTILSLKFKFPANNSKVFFARNLNF